MNSYNTMFKHCVIQFVNRYSYIEKQFNIISTIITLTENAVNKFMI